MEKKPDRGSLPGDKSACISLPAVRDSSEAISSTN